MNAMKFRNSVVMAAMVVSLASGLLASRPAQALIISGQVGDGLNATIAQEESFLPLTNPIGTFDFARITFRNSSVASTDLALDTPQTIGGLIVDLLVITGNLNPPFSTGDRNDTHDFVYTNTLTLNGVTKTFMQDAHADFTANSTTDISTLLELSAAPLLTFDFGTEGIVEVAVQARDISCGRNVASCGGGIGPHIVATLRAPNQQGQEVPEPGSLFLFASGILGLGRLRKCRRRRGK